jgi:hypothetical protein
MLVSPYTTWQEAAKLNCQVARYLVNAIQVCQSVHEVGEGFGKDTNAAVEHARAPPALLYTLWQVKILRSPCRLQPLPIGGKRLRASYHTLTTTFLVL